MSKMNKMSLAEKIKKKDAKVCVIGLGYMGLPLASLIAKAGFNVYGFDLSKQRAEDINKGKCPFDEKGMPELLAEATKSGNLRAGNRIEKADIFIVSVPTPVKDTKADLSYVEKATESVSTVLEKGNLVILESTVPPGCSTGLMKPILDKKVKKYYLAHCPERAIPGNTLYELQNNDRVVGGTDKESSDLAKSLYSSFVKGNIFVTNIVTAEAVKLFENTYRDVNIAIANSFHLICERLGISAKEAIWLASRHPRVKILSPGPGVGGHCIPIDPWFLVQDDNHIYNLIRESRRINDYMPEYVFGKIREKLKGIKNPVVTLLGLAYKPNVDDIRESPSIEVMHKCIKAGWKVKVHDPFVKCQKFSTYSMTGGWKPNTPNNRKISEHAQEPPAATSDSSIPPVSDRRFLTEYEFLVKDFDKAVKGSGIVVLLTAHDYYKSKDFSKTNLLDIFGALR
jgi:nucleotide sugar dehydrogenase